jgi:hypothetical protein
MLLKMAELPYFLRLNNFPMFNEALFTIANIYKQLKCLSMNKGKEYSTLYME